MCNVCGCKEAEDKSPKRKYRTPSKKQRRMEDDAMLDVDYMRDTYQTEFEAMETFPAGEGDVNMCIAELERLHPGIEINSWEYLTFTEGSSNKFHVFMETSEGNFNLYGRIGYGSPKVYGPMGFGQYHKKMNNKIRQGYRPTSVTIRAAEDEAESYDYTPETYDPLSESPESYDPMSESYSAEHEEDQAYDYTPETYDPLSDNPEGYDPMSESYSAHDCGCGVSSCRDCASACGCSCKCAEEFLERYEAPRKSGGRKRRYGKRQRFGNRYLARDAKGRWISNVGVGPSIRQDLRSDAKSQQPRNFRGLGDAKVHNAENFMLTDAIIQWEDGFGTSSPSAPPMDIMWAEEEYTEDYPQNSAQIDGVTGTGVPVSYGSGSSQYVEPPVRMGAEGMTYMHEDYIPNTYGEDSALTSGRGVPQWYGSAEDESAFDKLEDTIEQQYLDKGYSHERAEKIAGGAAYNIGVRAHGGGAKGRAWMKRAAKRGRKDAEHQQGYDDRDDESIGMRHRGHHKQSLKDRRDESKGMTDTLNPHHPYSDVSTMDAEYFEAPMQRFPPGKNDVEVAKSLIRREHPGVRFRGEPLYLIDQRGSANKFHVFLDSNKGGFNVYGRIGYPKPTKYGPMGQGTYHDKMRSKIKKGYKKTKFSAEANFPGIPGAVDDGYYPNTWGEDSASISGQGVPQWYGSAEHEQGYDDKLDESLGMRHRGRHSQTLKDRRDESKGMEKALGHRPYSSVGTMDAEEFELVKPIETGAKVGFGFILASVGSIIAATALGMLWGE